MSHTLPPIGRGRAQILEHLKGLKLHDMRWKEGLSTKSAFYASEDLLDVSSEAYGLYLSENALFAGGFKSLESLESEVVQIALSLLGDQGAGCGTFTSGGSESNFIAMYAARERARASGRLGGRPKVVAPLSAHVTVNKAAALLGLEVVRTALTPDGRADPAALSAAVDDDTIMVVGSAPCWPFGVVDPIATLAEVASRCGAWMHVDACVGGFSLPFIRGLGHHVAPFDLSVPGVHSISADIHKYGYSPKGASLVLFASPELKAFSAFEFDEWPSGYYRTFTFQGSRTGGPIAAAWATLHYLGEAGYLELADLVLRTKAKIEAGVVATGKLAPVNPTDAFITAYMSTDPDLDIHVVADALEDRGWSVSRVLTPAAIHLPLNPIHARTADLYLAHLREALAEAAAGGRVARRVSGGYTGDRDLRIAAAGGA